MKMKNRYTLLHCFTGSLTRFVHCRAARFLFILIMAGLAGSAWVGCSRPINTCSDLAGALRRDGVPWETSEPIEMKGMAYAKIDECVALTGEMLHVEIFRITDRRTFDNFGRAAVLLGAAEFKSGQRLPGRPDLFSHEPFVIVVRMEPEKGLVQTALNDIFNESF